MFIIKLPTKNNNNNNNVIVFFNLKYFFLHIISKTFNLCNVFFPY